jgi:hypothetical protein
MRGCKPSQRRTDCGRPCHDIETGWVRRHRLGGGEAEEIDAGEVLLCTTEGEGRGLIMQIPSSSALVLW